LTVLSLFIREERYLANSETGKGSRLEYTLRYESRLEYTLRGTPVVTP